MSRSDHRRRNSRGLDTQAILEEQGATSFAFASTEAEAVEAGAARRPDVITSDVKLIEGTGPRAVQVLHPPLGDVPVLFITGTPEACEPCEPPGRILSKPLNAVRLAAVFATWRPRSPFDIQYRRRRLANRSGIRKSAAPPIGLIRVIEISAALGVAPFVLRALGSGPIKGLAAQGRR